MTESSWDAYLRRKQEAQEQQRRRPSPQPAPQSQPEPPPNLYAPPGWTVAQDTSEEAHWNRRAQEMSERNRAERPQDWQIPAFNHHYNAQEQSQEQQALNERVQAVAQTTGIWKGLRLPPGSRFRPGKNEMVNGSQNTPAE